jgi:alkanesulfonate monooxygenase
MPVEFLGMGAFNDATETRPRSTAVFDPEYARRIARVHEDHGWDHVLFAYSSGSPDPILTAGWVAAHTERVQLRLAHRPNTAFPTVAARQFATLDQLSRGRLTVHFITGGSTADQAREGDYLAKDDRYERTREYIRIVKQAWTSRAPFSHHGRYYRFDDFVSAVEPHRQPRPLVSFGGSSAAAWQVGAAEADVYTLFGEPLADTADQQRRILTAAREQGRTEALRWQIAFRPIIAPTDAQAWERAHAILAQIRTNDDAAARESLRRHHPTSRPENAGSQRLLAAAERAEHHDRALWTATAVATAAAGSSTALVGSYETVAAALLDYVDLGFEIFGLRGYDFVPDAEEFGRQVIPLVRQEVAHRERTRAAATRPGPDPDAHDHR